MGKGQGASGKGHGASGKGTGEVKSKKVKEKILSFYF
jgi:hypothetical protein